MGILLVQIIPMIKEYLEINVKNDEQLVKLSHRSTYIAEGKQGSESEFV